MVPHFPPLHFGPAFSGLAFSVAPLATQRCRWPTVAALLSRRPNQRRALYNNADVAVIRQ